MMQKTENAKTALLVRAIWRLSEGEVHKYLPAERVPKEVRRFLESGASLEARRSALVAILDSLITNEIEMRILLKNNDSACNKFPRPT